MSPAERARVRRHVRRVVGLHVLGLRHLRVRGALHYKTMVFGVATLAYTLGLRHAFDADHIAAIDNTTRKCWSTQGTGKPLPFGFGFFFSLGHSSVVVAIGLAIVVAEGPSCRGSNSGSGLDSFSTVLRDLRVRVLPVPDRRVEHGHPGRDHPGVPGDAARRV